MHVGLAGLSRLAAEVEACARGEAQDAAGPAAELAAACRDGLVALERAFAAIRARQPANT